MSNNSSGPLEGLNVADFTAFIAGSYCAQLLGDMGAEVTKVEALEGDGARYWGPFLNGESRMFQGWNRNKQSIAVDMRTDKGLEIVHSLLKDVDILVENYRPGITKKLGIDYETVRTLNPKIIYLSITAFGAKGPYGKRPGYDPILQSLSGAARGNERYSNVTSICSVAISDYGAALLGSTGILAALYRRERTGEGQFLETSLLQAAMAVQSHMFVDALETEETPPFGIFPYQYFETKDDILFVAAPTDRFWQTLCRCLGADELAENPKFKTNPDRVTHKEELAPIVQSYMSKKTAKAWEKILLEEGVPCARAQNYEEFFDDPQVRALDMFPTHTHETIGPIRLAGVPITFHQSPGSIRSAAPTLGQHTSIVLRKLGYDDESIAGLRGAGIVK